MGLIFFLYSMIIVIASMITGYTIGRDVGEDEGYERAMKIFEHELESAEDRYIDCTWR